jgi:TRAP-type C4-dicarboxylate transport system permease small subunit
MRKTLDAVYDGAGAIGALFILAIFLLMLYASAGRMAGFRVGGVNDIVAWCCAAASFFAMAHAFKHGDFVRVTLLLEKVPPGVRRVLEVLSLAIAAAAVSYLAWWAVKFTYESYEFKDMASGLVVIPIWIPQVSFVLGALLFVVAVLDELVIVLRGGTPTYVRLVEERHARGDYSEDL